MVANSLSMLVILLILSFEKGETAIGDPHQIDPTGKSWPRVQASVIGTHLDHQYGENMERPIDPSGSNWKRARFEVIGKLSDNEEGKLPCTVEQTPRGTTVKFTDGKQNVFTLKINGFGRDNIRQHWTDHSSESHSSDSGEFQDRSGEDASSQHSDDNGRSHLTGHHHRQGDYADVETGYRPGYERGRGPSGQYGPSHVNEHWNGQPRFNGFAGGPGAVPNGHSTQYDPHGDSFSTGSPNSGSPLNAPYWASVMLDGQEQRVPVSIHFADDPAHQRAVVIVFQAKPESRLGRIFKGAITGGTNLLKAGVRKTVVTPAHYGFRLANGLSEYTEDKVGDLRESLRDPYATGFRKFLKTGTRKLVVSPAHTALRVSSTLSAVGQGLSGATREALGKRPRMDDYNEHSPYQQHLA